MIKQVIVIRKDLKMRRGKECAQVAHASMGAILNLMSLDRNGRFGFKLSNYPEVENWMLGRFTKVCLQVNSEQELLDLCEKAKEAQLIHCLITDAGKTEFDGVPTKTTLAIGPAEDSLIDKITGHLKLY